MNDVKFENYNPGRNAVAILPGRLSGLQGLNYAMTDSMKEDRLMCSDGFSNQYDKCSFANTNDQIYLFR